MKKVSTRTVLFVLLIAASLSSYIFLSTRADTHTASEAELIKEATVNEGTEAQEEIVLPDVRLLKKAIETGKRLVPTSSF
jgi:hypothetical protein